MNASGQTPPESDSQPLPPEGSANKDIQVFTALSSRSRADILDALSAGPKTMSELTKELRLPRVTMRYHLNVLLSQGLVEEIRSQKPRGVGRPAKLYRAARHPVVNGYPKRRYEMFGEIALKALVDEVGEERTASRLRSHGRQLGEELLHQLARRRDVDRWTPETFEQVVLLDHFKDQGAPTEVLDRSADHLTYRSFHCPFLELAEKLPGIVCDALDVGFHEGIDRAMGDVRTERLSCMGHGAPHCEYRMEWRRKRGRKRVRGA